MRSCDEAAVSRYGVPGIVLMENASRGAVDFASEVFGPLRGAWIIVIAGKGNNGGDGFAMARHFVNRGAKVDVLTLGPDDASKGDAHANLLTLRQMEKDGDRIRVRLLSSVADLDEMLKRRPLFVVDAMLGTGLDSPVRGEIADVIDVLNKSDVRVMAVDIPTGISSETGEQLGSAINAHCTATMGGLKRGLLFRDGRLHTGEGKNIDIGMPRHGFMEKATQTFLLESTDVRQMIPRRRFDVHKYQLGKVFALAGSVGYTGAAALASEAALRSGAGIVKLGIPTRLNAIMETKLTEVMTIPFAETSEGTLGLSDIDKILDHINTSSISIIGPGLSRHYETQNLVRKLLQNATAPLLIDADGLFALAEHLDILQTAKAEVILTPHTGEFARLVQQTVEDVELKRIDIARTFAVEFGVTLVLKGAPTVIADKSGLVYINDTGNPGMATAGSGDVLSGIIAGLAAQGASPEHAACSGVYLHGLSGDHARDHIGEYGLIAGDLLRSFAEILRSYTQEGQPS